VLDPERPIREADMEAARSRVQRTAQFPIKNVIRFWYPDLVLGAGDMRRREFFAFVGGTAAAWPLVARAQKSGKVSIIGFLGATTPSVWSAFVTAFLQRLRELGWIDGSTVAIEYRWAQGRDELYAEFAAEFVRLKVDVIVTAGTDATMAVQKATSDIPIVFAAVGDPVGTGLVASLAHPGGNVTGLSNQQTDLAGYRLELCTKLSRAFVASLSWATLVALSSS
jgi:putative tryptophan/tyrosine transport system substrate-binding protein